MTREMKPLMLPKLVAHRKSSKSSLDMSSDAALSVYSNTDSGFYSASECSTPPTPSFHRGHLRFSSSTSSLSSSPPAHDPIDVPNASGKLPKLTEDVEREDDYVCRDSADMFVPENHSISEAYDFATYGIQSKRRRSVEHGIQHRLERSFPSLSRKVRDRKRSSTFRSSRSTTPSRQPSTRSSSMTSSIYQPPNHDIADKFSASMPITACNSREQLNDSIVSLPIDVAKANTLVSMDVEEIDSERFATTPLLPPMLATARHGDVPTQSPLQSPTVATTDAVSTPIDSPPARAYPTPPLSTKASIASFKRSSPLVPSTDIPPIMLADPTDKWALTLGHDNFTIYPEPYMPDVCDATTRNELFADWQQARANFTKHQVRIAEHYGPTSKIYLLCEQKWAEIDAVWKKNHDLVKFLVPSEPSEPSSPVECVEPVPVSTIWPTLTDPKSEGKFPKLGDEDIVGPMVQAAPKVIQPITPRKRAFFKFLADLKFPGALLGRSSSSGLRGH